MTTANDPTKLPEGYKLDPQPAAKEAAKAAPAHTAQATGLPAGYKLDAAPGSSIGPVLVDHFKSGISNSLAMAPEGIAHHQMDMSPLGVGSAIFHAATSAAHSIKSAFGHHDEAPKPGDLAPDDYKGVTDKALGVKGLPVPPDSLGHKSKTNEYSAKIAEFLGANLIPGGSAIKAAEHKMATFMVSNLGTTVAGMGAVEGKEWGRHAAHHFGLDEKRGEQIGEFIGSLTGPGLVGLGGQAVVKAQQAGRTAAKAANLNGFSKEAQDAAAHSMLMKELQQGAEQHPLSGQNLDRAAELSKQIPGFKPTAAQASGAPGLVGMQKEVANKSGENLGKAAAIDHANAEAIAKFKEEHFPGEKRKVVEPGQEGEGEPKLNRPFVKDPITDPARAQLSATKSVRDLEIQKNEADLRKLSDQHKRTVDNQQIGQRLREKYWGARQTAKIQQDVNLADVYRTAKAQGAKADMSDLREHVKGITEADRTTFQDMPPLFQKILKEYPEGSAASSERQAVTPVGAKKPIYRTKITPATPAKNEASFEELHSMYKQANKDWADATAAGDLTKAHYMKQVRDRLETKVKAFEGPEHGNLAQKFKDFNAGYSRYAQTFKQGAGGEIAKRGKLGEVRDAEDIVSKTILKAGDKKKGVQDFLAMHGDDAEAHQLLHDGIMDNFSKATMKTGTFNPKAAKAWLANHKQAMDELPSLRAKLENSQSIGEALVQRKAVLLKQRAKLDQTYLAKVAKTTNPDALIQKALGDSKDGPHIMRALLVGAKSPESQQSIARAIVDSVTGKGHGLDYILQHESTLKPVLDNLGPKHWANLKTIAEAEEVAGRVKAPTQVELSQPKDLGQQTIGTSVKSLFASAKAAAAGRMSKEYALLDVGGRFLYKQRADTLNKLREEAVFNPEMGELLATMLKQKKSAGGSATHAQLLDLQRLAFNAGINATVEAVGRKREEERGRNTQD